MRPFRIAWGLVLATAVSGCATTMPLQPGGAAPDLAKKSVLVAHVKIRNDNHDCCQPQLAMLTTGVGNAPTQSWGTPTLIKDGQKAGKEYFASFEADAGKVRVDSISFRHFVPLLVNAWAFAKLDATVDVPPNKVLYLGTIDAVIVPRDGNEDKPRAGAIIPLLDQAIAGFGNGSWVIKVTDDFEADLALLKEKYPFLKEADIQKAVLELPQAAPAEKPTASPTPAAGKPSA